MIPYQIYFNELFLVETYRKFCFLEMSPLKYSIKSFIIGHPEPGISFKSLKNNREISLDTTWTHGLTDFVIAVTITNLSWFTLRKRRIKLSQFIKDNYPQIKIPEVVTDKNMADVLGQYASFMKENMMPIIEGKEWIDEYGGLFQRM